ncbi:AAA family ATPase [Actinacidiphila oryziradicis]|uniref:WD40 repeat domain-containing protein n=1 Tax=Actinacidiphila oryziradicis TaxID=2571141 RepID=A0A4U0S8E0_9ACTN|nr:AAA family ATPase [Actinacidiphila oryziradicis]TKA04833.1 hypothetical protein FCI23_34255 [Actinacidiphila oryziradicis]
MSTVSPPDAPGGPDIAAWPPPAGPAGTYGPALLDWAADPNPGRPRVCLIRGARGSGKSGLLAWFLAGAPAHPHTTVHAAVLAEGLFTDAFAWDLARQLGYGPLAPARLVDRLAADQRPLLLLVADLHRSGRGPADRPLARPRNLVEDLVVPLLELPQTRALIEVGDSGLLDGWAGAGAAETVDLGDPAFAPGPGPAAYDVLTAGLTRTPDGRIRWDEATGDVREHALDQALRAPEPEPAVRELLTDPGFLLHGSPVSVAACLADDRIPAPPGLRQAWRLAAPHLADPELADPEQSTAERAALLHTAALGSSPTLARYLLPLARNHVYSAAWARPDTAVTALAAAPGEPGALVAADPLGDLALLDAATGQSTAAVPSPSTARPNGMAVRRDWSMLLLTGTGALLPTGEDPAALLGRIAVYHGQAALSRPGLRPSAIGQSPCGSLVVVGDEQGNAHVWPLEDLPAAPLSRALHAASVTAVTCLALPDKTHTLVMSAAMDGTVRLWETSADPMPVPVEQRPALVTALAAAPTAHGPVLAVAWNDAVLHLWHLPTGHVRAVPLITPCSALALTPDCHLVVGGTEGAYALALDTVRLWD